MPSLPPSHPSGPTNPAALRLAADRVVPHVQGAESGRGAVRGRGVRVGDIVRRVDDNDRFTFWRVLSICLDEYGIRRELEQVA